MRTQLQQGADRYKGQMSVTRATAVYNWAANHAQITKANESWRTSPEPLHPPFAPSSGQGPFSLLSQFVRNHEATAAGLFLGVATFSGSAFASQPVAPRIAGAAARTPATLPSLSEAPAIDAEVLAAVEAKHGSAATERLRGLQALLRSARSLGERSKLDLVNRFFNRAIQYAEDLVAWKSSDYWATPLEALTKGSGDCEDYAIAKYFTLRWLGVDPERLRLSYVKALRLGQEHMVLTYRANPGAPPLVLDNLMTPVKPFPARRDLLPIWSFSDSGLWVDRSRVKSERVSGPERLSRWTELKQRMEAGAF